LGAWQLGYAIEEYVVRHDPEAVTDAMNRVAEAIDTRPDPALAGAARSVVEPPNGDRPSRDSTVKSPASERSERSLMSLTMHMLAAALKRPVWVTIQFVMYPP